MKNKIMTLVLIFTIVITTNFLNLKGAEEQPRCNSNPNCSPGKWREYSCTTTPCGGAPWWYFMLTCVICEESS
jgi:hypothetical protein